MKLVYDVIEDGYDDTTQIRVWAETTQEKTYMTGNFLGLGELACAAALFLTSCASGPQVRADYDKAADFGRYRTYGFVAQSGTDTSDSKSLGTQWLQNAAAREMENRGYTRSDTPDLVINFKGKLEEKTDIESVPGPYYGSAWGYRGLYGAPYGGWGGAQTYVSRYTVGTLVIDVVDREKREVVFQGTTEGIVTEKMQENREQTISQAVAQIFSKYPFVAGQSTPVALPDKK
jgi:hypothetical protein